MSIKRNILKFFWVFSKRQFFHPHLPKTIFFLKQKTSGAINYLSKRESLTQGKFIYLSTVYLSVKCNFKTYGFYIKTYFDQTFIKQFH
jgi:hypothetical protein